MPLTELQIGFLVDKYLRERDRFDKMAAAVARHLSGQLRASAIPHLPTFRAKDPESLRGKLATESQGYDFASFEREFAPSVLDLAGVRILLYRQSDIGPTCGVIEDLFVVPDGLRYRRDYEKPDGYQARHRIVRLRDDMLVSDSTFLNLEGVFCEVQVVTLSDHIWNELEHDILYKKPAGAPTEAQQGFLKVLRDQLNGVRTIVDELTDATQRQKTANLSVIGSPEDLSEVLKARTGRRLYGDFGRLLDLLVGGLTSVTPAVVARLPLEVDDLNQARLRLLAAGVDTPDDVAMVIGALWPTYGDDFLDISRSWPGRPSRVARLLQKLDLARKAGTI